MIKDLLKEADTRMHAAIQNLDDDLSGIRTGRATPALVERLQVEYFGAPTPLMQLALPLNTTAPVLSSVTTFPAPSLKRSAGAVCASAVDMPTMVTKAKIYAETAFDRTVFIFDIHRSSTLR